MTAPKRPKKTTTTKKVEDNAAEDQVTDQATEEVTEEISVDEKDALIAELQKKIQSEEDHKKQIKELKEQLAAAEKASANSGGSEGKEFKTRPGPDDDDEFFYFEIIWHPKRSDSDEEYVTIGVNGKMVIWPRNVPTVIRSDYLEVADNAFVPKFKQLPGEERKEIGGLKPYTYTINRKISEEEYTRRKKEGDLALRSDLQARGITVS